VAQKWPAEHLKDPRTGLPAREAITGQLFRVGGGSVYQDNNLLVCRWGIIGENRFGAPRLRVIGCFGHWFVLYEVKE
jgi:hypothetical protein